MAKEPKSPKVKPLQSADGPVPAENWDNDQRFTGEVDTSPGSVHDTVTQTLKGKPKPAK